MTSSFIGFCKKKLSGRLHACATSPWNFFFSREISQPSAHQPSRPHLLLIFWLQPLHIFNSFASFFSLFFPRHFWPKTPLFRPFSASGFMAYDFRHFRRTFDPLSRTWDLDTVLDHCPGPSGVAQSLVSVKGEQEPRWILTTWLTDDEIDVYQRRRRSQPILPHHALQPPPSPHIFIEALPPTPSTSSFWRHFCFLWPIR